MKEKKINFITIIFGVLSLSIGWLSLFTGLLSMIQLRQIAIVLLVLFFFSLNQSRIKQLEQTLKEKRCHIIGD